MHDPLLAVKVARVQRELPMLINRLDALVRQIQSFSAIAGNWSQSPRDMRSELETLKAETIKIEGQTRTTLGEASEVLSSAPSASPRVIRPGQPPPPFIDTGSIRAQAVRLAGLQTNLFAAVTGFQAKVRQLETAPGIYGTPPGSGFEVLMNLVQLIKDFVQLSKK